MLNWLNCASVSYPVWCSFSTKLLIWATSLAATCSSCCIKGVRARRNTQPRTALTCSCDTCCSPLPPSSTSSCIYHLLNISDKWGSSDWLFDAEHLGQRRTLADNVAVSRSPRRQLFLNWSPDSPYWFHWSFSNETHVSRWFLDQLCVHPRNTSRRDKRRSSLRTCEKQSVFFVNHQSTARTSILISNLGNRLQLRYRNTRRPHLLQHSPWKMRLTDPPARWRYSSAEVKRC